MKIATITGYAGIAYGLYFASKRNSTFLGYVGWAIVWSIALGGAGSILDYTMETLKPLKK